MFYTKKKSYPAGLTKKIKRVLLIPALIYGTIQAGEHISDMINRPDIYYNNIDKGIELLKKQDSQINQLERKLRDLKENKEICGEKYT